jgi:succinylglutamate desuccinylase
MTAHLPTDIDTFGGNHPGPSVLIVGGTHGNEPMGVKIIQALKKELKHQKINGEIILMIGNPSAVEKKVRAVDCDFNRLFGDEAKLKKKTVEALLKEEVRALEIMPLLKRVDYLLDIHSTLKPSIPFLYMENTPKHRRAAQGFSVPYIISPFPKFHNEAFQSCMDNFVDAHGGIGITYETGWHKDHSNFKKVLSNVKHFLKAVGVAFNDFESKAINSTPQLLFLYKELIAQTEDFVFEKDFYNFSFVSKGEVIAQDGNKPVSVDQDCYFIFPKREIKQGKTVTYLAKTLDQ